jgi:uncharacterized protein YndB with AHSA1/START domain
MQPIRLKEEIHIAKPVQDVFAAWSSASELARWFAPMAVVAPDVELDFRVTGRYSIKMTLPGNQIFTTAGIFQEIVPDEKIVMTWRCDAFPDAATLVTVFFVPDGAETTVKVLHENFEFEDTGENHRRGWELCLASLKEVLEA